MTHRNLSCADLLHRLFAYLDGELDAAAAAGIERHLEACRACFGRAAFERRRKARIAEAAAAPAREALRRRVRLLVERF